MLGLTKPDISIADGRKVDPPLSRQPSDVTHPLRSADNREDLITVSINLRRTNPADASSSATVRGRSLESSSSVRSLKTTNAGTLSALACSSRQAFRTL